MQLILTLAGALAAALALGFLTQRMKLSPIVGYLLAGIAVGPFTPGFTADHGLAEQLAELGIILLMFGVGLSFHFKELLAVRRIALPGALGQIAAATALGVAAALWLDWGLNAGLVFGLAISVASTVVLIRVLSDSDELHTPTGHIAVGWLVVEDLFTVVVLVLLPALAGGNTGREAGASPHIGIALLWAGLKIFALVGLTFIVGGRFIPWLLRKVAATGSRELFTLTILAVALGIAVGSSTVFGVSMALGAFLAGMVVGRSEFSLRAASEAMPMRDAFAVLFFVSVGMLFNPRLLIEAPGTVVATLGIVVLGKPLAALLIVLTLGYPVRTALSVAVALAQIGEFSFILAALGRNLGVLPDSAHDALVAAAIASISINPLLYRSIPGIERWLKRHPRLWAVLDAPHQRRRAQLGVSTGGEPAQDVPTVAVIGYGPAGRTLTRLLRDNGIQPVVIELNVDTHRRLREERISVVYGDAEHPDTLRAAGLSHAQALIISAAGLPGLPEIVRQARTINPAVQILARATYLSEQPALLAAGANAVFTSEGEVALAMTEALLLRLGATPEQIERERERQRVAAASGASV
jgi:CPA2 family monovalent cation:H+ antiporter-2